VVKRNIGMGWLVAAMTLISIIISVALVVGILLAFYGQDAARGVTVGEYWGFAIGFAVGVPAIACPVVGTQMLLLLRDLNKAREELTTVMTNARHRLLRVTRSSAPSAS
jgi:formate hydrogenlyase subunit 3/multisubunit Na+/H+ antiporter MnhD subunit